MPLRFRVVTDAISASPRRITWRYAMTRVRQATERAGQDIKERATSGFFLPVAVVGALVAILLAYGSISYRAGIAAGKIDQNSADISKLTEAVAKLAERKDPEIADLKREVRMLQLTMTEIQLSLAESGISRKSGGH